MPSNALDLDKIDALASAATAVPESWPMDAPILGTTPSDWAHNLAAFVALIDSTPTMWLCSSRLKYLVIRVDTRERGGFVLHDREDKVVPMPDVLTAIREARERFGMHKNPNDLRTLVPALVARVRELESERDALRSFVNAEREKTLARFRAGCLVCGAMAWKITTNGNMQCGQCANIFDAPIVAAPTIDAERAE